jgi:hypothetical protein
MRFFFCLICIYSLPFGYPVCQYLSVSFDKKLQMNNDIGSSNGKIFVMSNFEKKYLLYSREQKLVLLFRQSEILHYKVPVSNPLLALRQHRIALKQHKHFLKQHIHLGDIVFF